MTTLRCRYGHPVETFLTLDAIKEIRKLARANADRLVIDATATLLNASRGEGEPTETDLMRAIATCEYASSTYGVRS